MSFQVKKRIVFTVVLFILLTLNSPWANGSQEPSPPVIHVKNSSAPVMDLTQPDREYTIFKEGNTDEYLFKKIDGIAVDSKGNITILDFKRVIRYDAHGKFVKYIGSVGEGPGSYISPRSIYCDEKDGFYILDFLKIVYYKSNGDFVKNYVFKNTSLSDRFFVWDSSTAIGMSLVPKDDVVSRAVSRVDLKTGELTPLYFIADPSIKSFKEGQGGVMGGVVTPFSMRILLSPLPGQSFCFALNTEDKIRVCDRTGNLSATLQLDMEPQKIQDSEVKALSDMNSGKAPKKSNLPVNRPLIETIITDEKGNIYMVPQNPLSGKPTPRTVHVINREGKCLYILKMNFLPQAAVKGKIYGIVKDADDEISLKRVETPLRGAHHGRVL